MIDIDLQNLKILPTDHVALKDYDYTVGLEKKNKLLGKAIFVIIAAGLITFIYYVVKDEES